MTSKDRAKQLIFKFYTERILTDDEMSELNRYANNYTYVVLYEEMRNDFITSSYSRVMFIILSNRFCITTNAAIKNNFI